MDLRCRISRDLRLPLAALVAWLCAGCSDAVTLTRETESGGVVTYLFREDRGGPMGSPHRKAALKLMEEKCPGGYTVLRDGELRGYAAISRAEGYEGETSGRRWGIEFRCK